MHVIEKATLFTEITLEESATVSGGCDSGDKPTSGGSNSSSNSSATVTINNYYGNGSSNSPTPTPTPAPTPIRLLPVLDANSNLLINV